MKLLHSVDSQYLGYDIEILFHFHNISFFTLKSKKTFGESGINLLICISDLYIYLFVIVRC